MTHRSIAFVFPVLVLACSSRAPKPPEEQELVAEPPRPGFLAPAASLADVAAAGGEAGTPGDGLAGYPMFPDHHSGVVVFSAEGDLWQVPARGGLARRITTHDGDELFARFSPDGKLLAFTGAYDGNQDVFVVPAAGGEPRRLTFHPAPDQVIGWTPDSKSVLFRSRRDHPHGQQTGWTISVEGGDPVRVPLSRVARLSYEPGGSRVAINRIDREAATWKRYAGGMAAQIYVGDLTGGELRKLTTFKGTNAFPMWHGGRIYFLSDRTGTLNIWSMTPDGADLKQHTRFDDFDVRFPSLGDGVIAFTQRAEIYLLGLATDRVERVSAKIVSDALRTRTRFTGATEYLDDFAISPDGRHVALEVRGDLHLIRTARDTRRARLSAGSGVRERGLAFSPDGAEIATTSDASGETEIAIYDAHGLEAPRQLTRGGNRFKYPPEWAPRGNLIAYADSDNRLFVVPARGGAPLEVDRSPYGRIREYRFSPDGVWLAYTKLDDNYFSSIFLYNTRSKETVRVTDAYYNDHEPTWSTDGKYLVFLSERSFDPYLDRLDFETIVDKATKPYLVLLSADTRSPFAPDELWAEKERGGGAAGMPGQAPTQSAVRVRVDVDGIGRRIIEVPVPAGHYAGLWAGERELYFTSTESMGLGEMLEQLFADAEIPTTLLRFDFEQKKAEPFLEGIVGYDISLDGSTMAVRKPEAALYAFARGPRAPEGPELEEQRLPLDPIREQVEPREEWRQIFGEVWRMMRDFYFVPDMAQVDWEAVGTKYAALLPRVTTRRELEDLTGQMVAELSLGHTYVFGGDMSGAQWVPVGLLGADLEPHPSGRYRIANVYQGDSWDEQRRSPLAAVRPPIEAGSFLMKIDGRPVRVGENVHSHLQRAAGEIVLLTVAEDAKGRGARDVEVRTMGSEAALRYAAWVTRNRDYVAERTGGRVGYLHLPDMMVDGMVEFDRWYYPQVHKQGLIVDARYNGGGFVSELVVRRLARTVLAWSRGRDGTVAPYPSNTLNGRIVVLTNESAGSDGDIFPRAVQLAKLGPVIGTRTWGGVVGIDLDNPLVDKGQSSRPAQGFFDLERRWGIEGEGVEPDIVVDNDPAAEYRGMDAQLDRAVAVILEALEKNPPRPPDFGPSPDKSKKSWVEKYGQTDRP